MGRDGSQPRPKASIKLLRAPFPGRLGRPAELAEYAAFMVSERNSFMNAEVVIVDGGAIT